MKSNLKIAGVSVDIENLPTREQIYNLAMNTKEHRDNPLREEEINSILDNSGLWEVKEDSEKIESVIEEDNGLHTTITKKYSKFKR